MPHASHRIRSLLGGEADGWAVFLKARRMIAEGQPVLELTIGEHDIGTDAAILDEMHRAARAGHTGYAAVPGIPALRDRIAARLTAASGVPTTRDNVLVTPGGQAGLFAAHHAALDPGDAGLMIDPYYATYPGTIRAVGGRPVAVAARPENGFQPTPDDISKAAQDSGARSLLINSPNNPTGAVYGAETLDGIARVAQAHDLWVISDEVYDSQVWTGSHLPFAGRPGMAERTLTVGSMSKSHAMTGSRLGWVAGPAEVIADMIQLATHTTYGVAGFIQEAALFALDQGPGAERDVAAPFRKRRDALMDRLAQQQVLRAVPPEGAMYVMVDVRGTGMTGDGFAEALLDQAHVAVMPGESFGAAAAGHVRVALTLPDAAFETALDRLFAFAAERAQAA
jgi:arginine:pyruvate transaminase